MDWTLLLDLDTVQRALKLMYCNVGMLLSRG
uniref:Uncharacterized protein n=1 Tax=Anguilla anguilla TaxID=7936 RepID=A0A0E9RJH1_ANGAN